MVRNLIRHRKDPSPMRLLHDAINGEEALDFGKLLRALVIIVARVWGGIKLVLFAAVVLILSALALQLQVGQRNANIRRSQEASIEARQAAIDAKQAVEDAIKLSQQGQRIDPQFIVDALSAINRIEVYLCDGPCPTEGK